MKSTELKVFGWVDFDQLNCKKNTHYGIHFSSTADNVFEMLLVKFASSIRHNPIKSSPIFISY